MSVWAGAGPAGRSRGVREPPPGRSRRCLQVCPLPAAVLAWSTSAYGHMGRGRGGGEQGGSASFPLCEGISHTRKRSTYCCTSTSSLAMRALSACSSASSRCTKHQSHKHELPRGPRHPRARAHLQVCILAGGGHRDELVLQSFVGLLEELDLRCAKRAGPAGGVASCERCSKHAGAGTGVGALESPGGRAGVLPWRAAPPIAAPPEGGRPVHAGDPLRRGSLGRPAKPSAQC
jgi:hypothetical protein